MDFFRFWVIKNRRRPFSVQALLMFSLLVGITRGMLEQLLFGIETNGSDILAFAPFYFSLPFVYAAFISFVPGLRYDQLLQPVTFATLLGVLPPIMDFMLGGLQTHSVFYGYFVSHDFVNFPWLGFSPARNYPLGEAITIWLTFGILGAFVYARTKSRASAMLGIAIGYAAFLFYSLVIPALTSFLLLGYVEGPSKLSEIDAAKLRPLLFLLSAFQVLIAWFIDTYKSGLAMSYVRRFFHILPFLVLTVLGATLSRAEQPHLFIGMLVTVSTGIAVVAQNDFLPHARNSVRHRRAVDLANAMAFITCVMVLFSGYKFALLGISCLALSILYHYPFFNIRSTLFGSMKVEGLWALLTYLIGVFAGHVRHPNGKIISIAVLVFGGFSLFSTFKDAKDIKADHKEGRSTIYTYLVKKGLGLGRFQMLSTYGLGSLLIAMGLAYYPPAGYALWLHLSLSAACLYTGLRVHRRWYFQMFMFVVSAIIFNLIAYES